MQHEVTLLPPCELNGYIRNDVYYFLSKIQCSTDMWRYSCDDAYTEICNILTSGEELEIPDKYFSRSEFFTELREEVNKSYYLTECHPTEKLCSMIAAAYPDCIENLHCYGREVAMRLYLWLYAFNDVCKQIFEEE